jgi:hypothetical protein
MVVIKGIDMEKKEWRGRFKRGHAWRSTTVATCGVCGCKSNLWEMGGYPGMGPRLVCPGNRRFHDLHDNLSKKQSQVHWNDFGVSGSILPKSVIEELEKEIEEDRVKFQKKVKPDVIL